MLAETGVRFAILAFRAVTDAVGQDGLELVVVGAADVGMVIDDESGEVLPNRLTHEAGLAVVDAKAFIVRDGGYVGREAWRMVVERATGEGKIVGVSGVGCADGLRKAPEAAVEPVRTEVGECG